MKVKELMIPVAEYVTVGQDATLSDVFRTLEEDHQAKPDKSHAHRDVLVLDAQGGFLGKLTMTDILRSLEPNYKKLMNGDAADATLTSEYVAGVFRDFGLWTDTLQSLCGQAMDVPAVEAMHRPAESEFMEEDDDLEIAVHKYIMGGHQPLLVRRDGKVTGVIRLSDIFEEVRSRMTTCKQ
ncbi:CBS domain-containing protein [Pseudodesulfovibrio tunisiensis]|uniref:CBS domain-containing protein n=1 Tax=Pseudodesulfovibrio tunisiensis TaxID=463192 RepID=UPI001FB1D6A4|nr:CBS domain-containing protein [Pseudodesulfovibrio tunisiensis]